MSFQEIWKFSKKKSSKHTSYFPIYERLFGELKQNKSSEIKILEIGVSTGGFTEALSTYFGEKSLIVGLEFNPIIKDLKFPDNVRIHTGNAEEREVYNNLNAIYGQFDMIIDDGGHTNLQQLSALYYGFEILCPGGILIIEDTQCSYLRQFGNPSSQSIISVCKDLVDRINFRSTQLTGLGSKLQLPIESIELGCGVVVFRKAATVGSLESFQVFNGSTEMVSFEDYRFANKALLYRLKVLTVNASRAMKDNMPSWVYRMVVPIGRLMLRLPYKFSKDANLASAMKGRILR